MADYRIGAKGLGLISNDYINYSNNNSQNFNEREGTVEFWMKPEWAGNDGLNHRLFETGKAANLVIYKGTDNDLKLYVDNSALTDMIDYDVSSWLALGWHHVAATWNNYTSNMTLHIDGTRVNSSSTAFTIPTQQSFILGRLTGSDGQFGNATFSEFRISRKALTAQEINLSFSKGRQYFSNEFLLNRSNFKKDDSFKVEYTARDRDNQTGTAVNSSFLTVVNTPPVAVNISLPAAGSTVLDFVNITWNATLDSVDNESITSYFVLVNGTKQCENTGSVLNCTFTPSANGFYLFNLTAFDGTDNSTPTNRNFTFTNLAPNVTFYDPTLADAAVITANTFTVNVSINETTVDVCRLEIYNSTNASRTNQSMTLTKQQLPTSQSQYSCSVTVSTSDGVTYYYRVFTNDTPVGAINVTGQRSVRENVLANFSPYGLGSARNVSLNVSTVNPATSQPQSLIPGTTAPSSLPRTRDNLIGFAENYSDADRDFEANSTFKWYTNNTNQSQGGNRTAEMAALIYKGAVGYWHMDDDVVDSIAGGNSGTVNGNPVYTQGAIRSGLDFDGNDYVTLGDRAVLDPGLGNFTVMAWFNQQGAQASYIYSDYGTSTNNFVGLNVQANGTPGLTFRDGNANQIEFIGVGAAPKLNTWHHAVLNRRNQTEVDIYLDGELVGTGVNANMGSVVVSGSKLPSIGKLSNSLESFFNGIIDEVAIYSNRTFTAADIKQIYLRSWYDYSPQQFLLHPNYPDELDNSTQNTTLLLHFNDGTGSTATDSSPYGNNGNITGAFFTNDSVSGSALNLDGTDDYVNISDSASLKFGTGPFTLSAWVKFTGTADSKRIVSKYPGGNNAGYEIVQAGATEQGDFSFYLNKDNDVSDSVNTATLGKKYNDGRWHQVVGTRDGTNVKMYVDGVLVATGVDHRYNLDGSTNLAIGSIATGTSSFWNGAIDEVKIVNGSLTAAEIAADYRKGVRFGSSDGELPTVHPYDKGVRWQPGRFVENLTVEANTTGYWRFDEGTGQNVSDLSVLNNAGILGANGNSASDDPTWVNDSAGGKALKFDGVNDQVDVPKEVVQENSITNTFTFEAWIKQDAISNVAPIFSEIDSSYTIGDFELRIANGNLSFFRYRINANAADNLQSMNVVGNLSIGVWYHVAAT
ncbi:MAG: LamG domain-containing protein, partial [Nanoarchaeota archaeon]